MTFNRPSNKKMKQALKNMLTCSACGMHYESKLWSDKYDAEKIAYEKRMAIRREKILSQFAAETADRIENLYNGESAQ